MRTMLVTQAKAPKLNTNDNLSFFAKGICRRRRTGKGRIKMTKSDAILMDPERTPRASSCRHRPGVLGIHNLRRGLH